MPSQTPAEKLIILQALATLAKEQAENQDWENLTDTISLIHEYSFEVE